VMTTMSGSEMTMKATTRAEMGLMAGVLATVAMTIAVIILTAISSAWNGFFPIQWYPWFGAVFGGVGTPGQLAELGVAWFVVMGLLAGLISAFAFKRHTVSQGLAFGGIAWLLIAFYTAFWTAPQLSGTLPAMGVTASIELLVPLAICFAVWGLVIGYVGKRYV